VIEPDDTRHILISFDILGEDVEYLEYSLVHCNADWQPSDLLDSEFLDGFNVAKVNDYAWSTNTFEHYVNYNIRIPDEQMRPTISGNYLLQVYPEGEREDILLQARFSVDEGRIKVLSEVTVATDRGTNNGWQQLSLKLLPGSYQIRDPFSDLTVVVEQNGQASQAVVLKHPQRLWGNDILYEHLPELVMPALNEFRRFETVRATYPGMNVDSVRYGEDGRYHAYLRLDQPWTDRPHLYDQTQYGRFKIDEYNATDPDLAADYIQTHFTLDFPQMIDADMYVIGEFSQYLPMERYRMQYNPEKSLYELEASLKQGSYNYKYMAVPRSNSSASLQPVDGNKSETSNRYDIRVYQREPSWRADRLVGTATIFSNR